MKETEAELDQLQALLDSSLSRATDHLQSIIKAGERTLTARQLVTVITGMCTLALATVAASGEPRISAVDGHFLHGRRSSPRPGRPRRPGTWAPGPRRAWPI